MIINYKGSWERVTGMKFQKEFSFPRNAESFLQRNRLGKDGTTILAWKSKGENGNYVKTLQYLIMFTGKTIVGVK